jgi:hypothetical protein
MNRSWSMAKAAMALALVVALVASVAATRQRYPTQTRA